MRVYYICHVPKKCKGLFVPMFVLCYLGIVKVIIFSSIMQYFQNVKRVVHCILLVYIPQCISKHKRIGTLLYGHIARHTILFILIICMHTGSVLGPLLFNTFINDNIHASELLNFILYADDTTLNSTLDCHSTTTDEIESSIVK